VAKVFAHPEYYTASTLLWGIFLFALQIYCDFSGYSDIAIGCARLFGFRLLRNFRFPYFARDITEFWRRWHVSLTSWFRDYLYAPLGGSNSGRARTIRNVAIVFLLSGLWHGANWTFVAWGAYNALLFLPFLTIVRRAREDEIPSWRDLPRIALTFLLALIGWVFFRAATIQDALDFLRRMVDRSLFSPSKLFDPWLAALIVIVLAAEWLNRSRQHALEVGHLPAWQRRSLYLGTVLLIMFFGRFARTDFIYFQF
jgi:D-alanyl-lipoteichoic acid acyltransferase DltB (MBOAT superfamily)